jgi:predicted alpha/beta superfamily hydrolase
MGTYTAYFFFRSKIIRKTKKYRIYVYLIPESKKPNTVNVIFLRDGRGVKRGYSLIGKTAILHIVILGSSPNISIKQKK